MITPIPKISLVINFRLKTNANTNTIINSIKLNINPSVSISNLKLFNILCDFGEEVSKELLNNLDIINIKKVIKYGI